MTHYNYLIIGGGMTAAAAVSGVRQHDGKGTIGIITNEHEPPYDRPPLSKQLWTGKRSIDDLRRDVPQDVAIHRGRTVVELDPAQKRAVDREGNVYHYGRLLLATGGRPRRLPFGQERIIYFRTLDSYRRLKLLAQEHDRFAVIGGGFIGSEIAAALAMNGKQVTLLFPDAGIGAAIFPPELSAYLNDVYRHHGVQVLQGETAVGLEGEGTELTLLTGQGRRLGVNGVVAGIGIKPNVELARSAGLEVGDGILVDRHLRTSVPDIYAAGDVANFPDPLLGRRRVEHEDGANTMGRAVGQAMAGAPITYDHSPMFYSDLFDLGYEAVGQLDSRLEMVAEWLEPCRKGIVYYLKEDQLRGVLLWNVWDQVEAARKLLAEPAPSSREKLLGRLTG